MSWLARSLVNSLRPDPADSAPSPSAPPNTDSAAAADPTSPTRRVQDDLSELSQTLSRQFRGFASFLAPPPTATSPPDEERDAGFAAIRGDLAEIGGRVRSGIGGLLAGTEISKIASTIFGGDDDDDGEISEEVIEFVKSVSMHPETWLEFPLLGVFHTSDDFRMSDAQQEHALDVERLVPRLASLRIQLCPGHMHELCFWKIYFVLVHPRLSKQEARLLSTPQIVQARAMLLQYLQTQRHRNSQSFGTDLSPHMEGREALAESDEDAAPSSIVPDKTTSLDPDMSKKSNTSLPSAEFETDKHTIKSTEVRIVEKSVIEEEPRTQPKGKVIPVIAAEVPPQRYEDGDEWLEEETGETSLSGGNAVHLGDEEDVSFSDLEAEDDDDDVHVSSKTTRNSTASPAKKGNHAAVRSASASSPPTRELNDWLDVDIDAV